MLFCAALGDLADVLDYLTDLSDADFSKLGLQLGLLSTTLDKCERETTHKVYGMKVMEAWLLQNDNVKSKGVPSWQVLVNALRKRSVDRKVEAENIQLAEISSKREC